MASTAIYIKDFRTEIPGALSEDRLTWYFPIVESINAHKKLTNWRVYVRLFKADRPAPAADDMAAFLPIEDIYFDSAPLVGVYGWIKVDSGVVGGKIKESVPTVVTTGKNLGKKSATNVFTQALRDAYGLYNKQIRKAASVAKTTTEHLLPPMLAQVYNEKSGPAPSLNNPIYIQRKYNGVRTVATLDTDGETVILYSRRKKLYPGFSYIKAELKPVFERAVAAGQKLYLDGEIYKHGAALQDISGAARREKEQNDERYDFMIYDCFLADKPQLDYIARLKILEDIFAAHQFEYCKLVETYLVHSMEQIKELYDQFLAEKYEGAMLRLPAEPYVLSHNEYRSRALLKMKPTYDAEYEIVGWETGEKGKAAGALMMVCKTKEGKIFPVTPVMELAERRAMARKMAEVEPNGKTHFENHWKGRPLIIYYDEVSKDNIPQRARTKMEIRTWD